MDIHQIEREIKWYTDEIDVNKRNLKQAQNIVRDLESKIHTNQAKLQQFTRDLSNAESAEKRKQFSVSKK